MGGGPPWLENQDQWSAWHVQAAAVAEGTVRSTYKDMHVYMTELVPSWFASEKDLQNLPSMV